MGAYASSRLARQAEIPRYELDPMRMFIMQKQRLYSKAQTKVARRSCEISGQVIPAQCYPCEPRKYMIHWITTNYGLGSLHQHFTRHKVDGHYKFYTVIFK